VFTGILLMVAIVLAVCLPLIDYASKDEGWP
jgi:hypothetical protein